MNQHSSHNPASPRRRRGFSMVEVLMAAMILAIGFIMLLPAFTVGLNESRISQENAVSVQLAQNADAFCRQAIDLYRDGNFTDARVSDGNIHIYQFKNEPSDGPAGAMAGYVVWRARNAATPPQAGDYVRAQQPDDDDAGWTSGGMSYASRWERSSLRILGDPRDSKYYWSLLFRFPQGHRSKADLWIMVCRRDEIGNADGLPSGNMLNGIRNPTALSVSGQAGDTSFDAGSEAGFLEPGSGVVTDQGEILQIKKNSGGTVQLVNPVQLPFAKLYVVKYRDDANSGNACIRVVHTRIGG